MSPIAVIASIVCLLAGVLAGWFLKSGRTRAEKAAINEGWQAQMDATRNEHRRLSDQNKRLMEQVSELQSASRQSGNQARELSTALKEALARRDDLQRDIKVVRNNLETVVNEKHRLKSDLSRREATANTAQEELKARDARIEKLKHELRNWQDRLPPLVEKFRERNVHAEQLETELDAARERIAGLEEMLNSDETRIGPMAAEELLDSVEASNEWLDDGDDRIDDEVDDDDETVAVGDATTIEARIVDATTIEEMIADGTISDATFIEAMDKARLNEPEESDDTEQAFADETVEIGAADEVAEIDEPDAANEADEASAAASTPIRKTNGSRFNGGLRDDLKAIKGVGPAIEKTLNELGIFRYAQVAEMSTYDIERIANRLKGFKSRIEREDWIGQARSLSEQKATAATMESGQGEF